MKTTLLIISVAILMVSCKKLSSSQIDVSSYIVSPNGYYNVTALMIYPGTGGSVPSLSDTVRVIVSAPLPTGTEIDTIYIPPHFNTAYHDAGPGNVGSQTPCTILSVTSNGGYSFSY